MLKKDQSWMFSQWGWGLHMPCHLPWDPVSDPDPVQTVSGSASRSVMGTMDQQQCENYQRRNKVLLTVPDFMLLIQEHWPRRRIGTCFTQTSIPWKRSSLPGYLNHR
jgi:hypothetical protein